MTDADRTTQNAAARTAAAAAVADISPRERGREKDSLALEWIYRWGFSSATLTDAFASPNRRGVAARLEKKKLIIGWPCEAAGGIPGIPDRVFTLARQGVEEIECQLTEDHLLGYPRESYKVINWNQLRHDLLIQKFTIDRLHSGIITGFQTPREIDRQSKPGQKQPDAVWISEEFGKIAVELELTIKHGRQLDQTMLAVLLSVKPPTTTDDGYQTDPGGPYDEVWYLCGSDHIRNAYQKAYQPGSEFSEWERHPKNKNWIENDIKKLKVPAWADERIAFGVVEVARKKRSRRAPPGSVL
jgi:hypothetical protein